MRFPSRKSLLKGFVEALEREGVFRFDIEEFESRLKLQKYVYLGRYFDLPFTLLYSYSLYIHGPYSPDLAKDYYSLDDVEASKVLLKPEFIELIRGKNSWWLELASTIMMIASRYYDIKDEEIIELVKMTKLNASKKELKRILNELRKSGILN